MPPLYAQISVGFTNLGRARQAFGGAVDHRATRPLGQGKPHNKRYCALPTVSLIKDDNAYSLQSINARPVKAFNRRHMDIALLVQQRYP